MENKLKLATTETIQTLNSCNIRTIMATGDNTLTAISVGRGCGILDADQDVYFGDIEDDKLIWRLSKGDPDADTSRGSCNDLDEMTVPWTKDSEQGVALNGKTGVRIPARM